MTLVPRPLRVGAVLAALALAPAIEARVEVTLDAASLNELIVNMAPERIPVKLTGGRAIEIHLENLQVTGFDPAAGDEGRGHVLTSMWQPAALVIQGRDGYLPMAVGMHRAGRSGVAGRGAEVNPVT